MLSTRIPSTWTELVDALAHRNSVGGDMETWLFHGTCGRALGDDPWWWRAGILQDGLRPALEPEEDEEHLGVFLGTPRVAAHFAVNRARKSWIRGQEGWEDDAPCLIAVPIEALDRDRLAPDTFMLENPVAVDLTGYEVQDLRERRKRARNDWHACLGLLGSVIYRGSIAPDRLTVMRSLADLKNVTNHRCCTQPDEAASDQAEPTDLAKP